MFNLLTYTVGSCLLTAGMVVKSFYQHGQYYPTVVYLAQSKACNLIMVNFVLMLVLLVGKLMKKILLGPLRDQEVENLQDRLWTTIMDTLLAMTVFQDEFNTNFFIWFGSLLGIKIFHWVVADRIDFMTRSLSQGVVPYLRIIALMGVLAGVDIGLLYYTGNKALADQPSMMLLFAFEYVILVVTISSLFLKFLMNSYDLYQAGRWEAKGVVTLYLDFLIDVVQLIVYVAFFVSLLRHYGLPLHLIRQMYFTFRSFWRRVTLVMRYQTVTRDMDRRFPVATPQQLADERADVCIVCREPMESGRVLPCGHIMHRRCLLSWLERSQTCPICRESVIVEEAEPNHADPNNFNQLNQFQQFHFNQFQQFNNNNNNDNNNNNNFTFRPQQQPPPPQQQIPPPHIPDLPTPTPPSSSPFLPTPPTTPLPSPIHFSRPPVLPPSPITLPSHGQIIEHVETLQDQVQAIQEQLARLLHDLRHYQLYSDYDLSSQNLDTSILTGGAQQIPTPSLPVITTTTTTSEKKEEKEVKGEKNDRKNESDDLDPDEVRKRRILRFSSEHQIPKN